MMANAMDALTDGAPASGLSHEAQGAQATPRRQIGERRIGAFRGFLLALLVLLVPQFVLGMLINLYVPFPGALLGRSAWQWALSQPLIQLHLALGTLLVILALATVALGIATHRVPTLAWSLLGCVMLLLAWLSGDLFLSEGQQATRSLTMALGFLGALIAYAVGYYMTRLPGKALPSPHAQRRATTTPK